MWATMVLLLVACRCLHYLLVGFVGSRYEYGGDVVALLHRAKIPVALPLVQLLPVVNLSKASCIVRRRRS